MTLARTAIDSPNLPILSAEGVYLYDESGKKYLDLIAGIAVNNVGHSHPKVIQAVKEQVQRHAHVMVYGEFSQRPQQQLAAKLAELLPSSLSCSYLVNSGSEAAEGALKLARKHTNRTEILSCVNGYHGSTFGALSTMGNELYKSPFKPLLPDVSHIQFNEEQELDRITDHTACVLMETIQGEAGTIAPINDYLIKVKERCQSVGALLILDEIQTGFGRTGKMFGFENYNVIPDVVLFAKALGGGYPLGAFTSSEEIMNCLSDDPPLGHITTFGGHPVSCAAAIANIEILSSDGIVENVKDKGELFKSLLHHDLIAEVRGIGLMLAVQLQNADQAHRSMDICRELGLITDWFLFADDCLRIAPPLTISEEEIDAACKIILRSLDRIG
ncbi:MAG TPA: aspartate aminotransferase family protein [Flavobacteriales bacterium]|nr:aspartate aminotransferase family protein [Flavobacteriales bacterium]HIA13256.1 aspartate aminotransferase family protein [Flavobacteriales bacterium]HIO66982.1 aspartate aminotransferase family protein [Flavobacteriales bacterium]